MYQVTVDVSLACTDGPRAPGKCVVRVYTYLTVDELQITEHAIILQDGTSQGVRTKAIDPAHPYEQTETFSLSTPTGCADFNAAFPGVGSPTAVESYLRIKGLLPPVI